MEISRIKSTIDNNPVQIKQMLNNAIQTTDDAIATVRKIASSLRPPLLDDMGLGAAIELHTTKFSKTSGLRCTFTEVGSPECIDKDIAIGLFRIFQEALTNIIRHAFATRVYISLIVETTQITLTIHDNGLGFDLEKTKLKKTLGLTGMKERAFAISGDLHIQSSSDSGTTIKTKIKL
jgi:signal transduction histidine kinase